MSIAAIALAVALVVLLALAILQVLVAAGQPFGRLVWGGAHEVLPTKLRIGSVVSMLLYALFALVLIDRSGLASVFGGGVFWGRRGLGFVRLLHPRHHHECAFSQHTGTKCDGTGHRDSYCLHTGDRTELAGGRRRWPRDIELLVLFGV